jgi:hypothetical protein
MSEMAELIIFGSAVSGLFCFALGLAVGQILASRTFDRALDEIEARREEEEKLEQKKNEYFRN